MAGVSLFAGVSQVPGVVFGEGVSQSAGVTLGGMGLPGVPFGNSTVVRNSVGYAETAAGALVSFPINTKRQTDLGLLVEGPRTNLLTFSQAFSNAAWVSGATQLTITDNNAVGPDGTMTASRWANTSTSNAHRARQDNLSVTNGSRYTLWCIVRMGTHRYLQLVPSSVGFAAGLYANYDLQNGVVTAVGTGQSLFSSDIGITSLTGGYYLCWLTVTANLTTAVSNAAFSLQNSPTASQLNAYAGTATTVFVWAAGVAPGLVSAVPVLTVASAVTTAADVVTYARTGTPAGTVVIEAIAPLTNAVANVLWEWHDASENNRHRIERNTSREVHYIVTSGGVGVVDLNLGIAVNGGSFKVAAAWALNDYAASLNGEACLTDAAGALPVGLTTIQFGGDSAGNYLGSYIASALIYAARQSNAELEADALYPPAPPPLPAVKSILIDADDDSDIDDAIDSLTALALEKGGECTLPGYCVTSSNAGAAGCQYAFLNFYGRTAIPMGQNVNDLGTSTSVYIAPVIANYGVAGHVTAADFEYGVQTYRRTLWDAPDGSVPIIVTGGGSTLALTARTGRTAAVPLNGVDLINRKAKEIWIVAGNWPSGAGVSDMTNTRLAYQWVFDNLNVPIMIFGVDQVGAINTGGNVMVGLAANNPVRFAWETYFGGSNPANTRPGWAQPAILAAVRGMSGLLSITGANGYATVSPTTGATQWNATPNRKHNYLGKVMSDANFVTTINALIAPGP